MSCIICIMDLQFIFDGLEADFDTYMPGLMHDIFFIYVLMDAM